MKAVYPKNLLIGITMLAAAGLALALTPRLKMADQGMISLEAMIPQQIDGWKLDETPPFLINPELESQVDKIYSQTLARSYINSKGERIMLSVAYGGDQSVSMQVHRPERCYVAQGFQIMTSYKDVIDAGRTKLPVMKLVATQGQRIEPVTYWVMIGDSAVRGRLEQNLARWKYGLTGQIPFGMVIRISTISANESQAYRTQEQFVRDMLNAVPAKYRVVLTGAGL